MQERQVIVEASPTEKIEQMESHRSQLMKHRADLQSKIDRLANKPSPPDAQSQ